MLVKDWIDDFLSSHLGRPIERSERNVWLKGLIEAKAAKGEAEVAAGRLRDQEVILSLETLTIEIGLIRQSSQAPPPADRDDAQARSRNCPHCCGSGQSLVFHPLYDGSRVRQSLQADGRLIAVPAVVAAHCVCPMGRWMRSRFKPEDLRRIPDFGLALAGRLFTGGSAWLPYDPTDETAQPLAIPMGRVIETLAESFVEGSPF